MSVQNLPVMSRQEALLKLAEEGRLEALREGAPLSFWQMALRRLRRDRLTMAALLVLLLITLLSIGARFISSQLLGVDPDLTQITATFKPPSAEHWLGTDALGRDQLSRLLFGGRISLAIGFFGTIFTAVFGITIGISAAYFGRRVDDFIMWVINTLDSIPQLFLLLIVGALFELSPAALTLLFALLGWPFISRLVRSSVFSLKEREYIAAAEALGMSDVAIMWRHIVPNVIPLVIVATARQVGNLILAESALSFLGFGVQPPTSTWGTMLTKAQQFILVPDARHLVVVPGVMIALTVLCLFIIGDGLRDAMDPRLN
ncbi:MAG: ABC transporter permease [Ardenticatenaceae bacterium]|nr:ABC transporter permease [Ardenticatenaceae bacterium]